MSKLQETEGPGLRLGAGGQVMSSGCNDLDQLCGGGLALGSLVIILEVFSFSKSCLALKINPRSPLWSPAALHSSSVHEPVLDGC